ncbi:MAG: hypothetical protein JXD23_04115 [Spirochaetales bacterium]|nr:hypothetical protein [Spirochaetales bacterium]
MEKKIAVIYTSVYGSTQTYAEWIAWALGADLFPARGKREDLLEYDVIIYGGYRRPNGIAGLDYIAKNLDALKGKRLIVFCVGAGPVRARALDSLLAADFKPAERAQIAVFGLRGAFNFRRLHRKDRIRMSLLRTGLRLRNPASLDENERVLLDAFDNPVNFTDEKLIAPIVKAARSGGRPIAVGVEAAARMTDGGGKNTRAGRTKTAKMAVGVSRGKKKKKYGKKKKSAKRDEKRRTSRRVKAGGKKRLSKKAKRGTRPAARRARKVRATRRKRAAKGGKRVSRKPVATKRSAKKKRVRRTKASGKKRAVRKAKARKRPVKRRVRKSSGKRRVTRRAPTRAKRKRVAAKRTAGRKRPVGKKRVRKSATAGKRPARAKRRRSVSKRSTAKRTAGRTRPSGKKGARKSATARKRPASRKVLRRKKARKSVSPRKLRL